ncbi:MAG: Uma2 family endonuclease [Prochloraceae cyanobacterium]|nr:Uma2 family endonuclease [Prochloraceae cyanobacterium]
MITKAKWSIDDYHRMIKAGILNERRVELLNGEIIEMSPEGSFHASTTDRLAEILRSLLRDKAKVREAHPITLIASEPEPDIAVVKLPSSLYRDRHPYPEDIYLSIEISDTTLSYDLGEKKLVYARALIQEYWVVDIKAKKLTVFRQPINGNYQSKKEYATGKISPVAFRDIAIDIQDIFVD